MTTADPSFPIPDNPANLVTEDLPCRKCGYNLRGLTRTHRCPECATPVGLSVSGDLLRYADPAWLEKLRRGINLILIAIFVMFLFVLLMAFGIGFLGNAASTAAIIPMIVISFGAWILVLVGTWMMTAPDPSGLGEDQYGTARTIIRVTLFIGIGRFLIDGLSIVASPSFLMVMQIIKLFIGISTIVGFFAQLQYLRKLALRIPDLKLSARAKFLMIAIPIAYGGVVIFTLIPALLIQRGSRVNPSAGCVSGIFAIALTVFAIMYLFMLERFAKAFKHQVLLARQTWSAVI